MNQTERIVRLSGQTESESLEKTVLVVCRIKGRGLVSSSMDRLLRNAREELILVVKWVTLTQGGYGIKFRL